MHGKADKGKGIHTDGMSVQEQSSILYMNLRDGRLFQLTRFVPGTKSIAETFKDGKRANVGSVPLAAQATRTVCEPVGTTILPWVVPNFMHDANCSPQDFELSTRTLVVEPV